MLRVTSEIVSKLCHEGHVFKAVEALGVLVQTDCCIRKCLLYEVLKECVFCKDVILGRRVHAFAVRKGYESDTFLCNHILRMYASHGRLQDAIDVFSMVSIPDAFMWSSIISAHVRHGQYSQGIKLYNRMRETNGKPDGHVFMATLQACAKGSDLETGQQVHADVLASGIELNLFLGSGLVDMYAKCGSLEAAQGVFDRLGEKNVVTWNAMIAGYSQNGMGQEALRLYSAMEEEGTVKPDSVTFVCLLQACVSVGTLALEKGRHLHAKIRERGHDGDVVVNNSLVDMYAKCGNMEEARRVFDRIRQRDVVTWNIMIGGYSQQCMCQEALHLYSAMLEDGTAVPDAVTFVCLTQACASVGTLALEKGKQLHAQIREQGHQGNMFVVNSLIHMYAKCGSLQDAQTLFDGLETKAVVTWNAMISGYSHQGMGQEALRLYSSMQDEGIAAPDSVTYVCLLQACASVGTPALEKGKQLHGQIREHGYQADVFVGNSLVNMYAKCGSLEDAQRVFEGLNEKDVVTWNAMIAGWSQQGMGQEALRHYSAMQEIGMTVPDSVTFVCLLQACASVGYPALEHGRQLHAQMRERDLQADVFLASSLVNMYAKCGSLDDAQGVFDELAQKDVVAWNALIAGYSQQGLGQEALSLYSAMQEEGMAAPNSITFVCLLQACANVAALHVGRQLHARIEEQGLHGDAFVAGSLINMYGKCGSMVDAQQVFDTLPDRDTVTWSALIASYTCHGDSEVVLDLVQEMKDDGIEPVGITFLSLLTVCSHAGLVKTGREYFDSMTKHYRILPTVEHYTCMVDLFGRAGQLGEALALMSTMDEVPDTAMWHTLLAACRKWGNVEVARHAFNAAVKLDQGDAAAYVLMISIYTGAQMWEQAQEIQAMRTTTRPWKKPGQSWWTDMDGLVHSFVVGDKQDPEETRSELEDRHGRSGAQFRGWR